MSSMSSKLTIATLLCFAGMVPYPAVAEEAGPSQPSQSLEIRTKDSQGNNRTFLIFDVHNSTEGSSYRDFLPHEKEAITNSLQYISDLIGFPQAENIPHVKLELKPDKTGNASAGSEVFARPRDNQYYGNSKLAECLQKDSPVSDSATKEAA